MLIPLPFQEFPKIGRLSRNCTITEKIDGTNAQIRIANIGDSEIDHEDKNIIFTFQDDKGLWGCWAGSRNRWITPADDNYGFARWVNDNRNELYLLGEGAHYGEWWGYGIQRGYGMTKKRFSLFNVHRWRTTGQFGELIVRSAQRPACCELVPILYEGVFTQRAVDSALSHLAATGSAASPEFAQPEGIVIYHHAAKQYFKKTIEKDDTPKAFHGTSLEGIIR